MNRSFPVLVGASAFFLITANARAEKPTPSAAPQSQGKSATKENPSPSATKTKRWNGPPINPIPTASPRRPNKTQSRATTEDESQEQERHDRREETLENRLVWLTGGLAVIEVATLFLFAGTMWANIKAAKASTVAANASAESAAAAKISTDLQTRSFYTIYRPWVIASDFEINRGQNGKLQIEYRVYNAGPLPATLRGHYANASLSERIADDPEFAAAVEQGLVLAPNSTNKVGFIVLHHPLTQNRSEWEQIVERKIALFFLGYFLYEGPYRSPSDAQLVYKTGFGARHCGPLGEGFIFREDRRTLMEPITDPRYSYIS